MIVFEIIFRAGDKSLRLSSVLFVWNEMWGISIGDISILIYLF